MIIIEVYSIPQEILTDGVEAIKVEEFPLLKYSRKFVSPRGQKIFRFTR
jgi:hypothetical protein